MKKDAFYFPHDSNAKDDPKCVLLIDQLGCEGYGIYWILIEILREQPEYSYPIALLPSLAKRYGTSFEKIKAVVCNYGLFIIKDDIIFFSESLIRRMKPLEDKRLKNSLAGKESAKRRALKRNERSTNAQHLFNERSTDVQHTFNIKEKRKEENISNNIGESTDSPTALSFENIWSLYGKKGNKKTSERKWGKLSITAKEKALAYIPAYVEATPDKQYRKNFETFLNQECWSDELPSNDPINKTEHETKYRFID